MNNQLRLSISAPQAFPQSPVQGDSIAAQASQFTPTIDHWVLQLHGVPEERINNPKKLQTLLNRVVDRLELTRVSDHSHYFHPGVSTVIILSESHLSAHTWPEFGYMHVDIVTCVRKLTAGALQEQFAEAFSPAHTQVVQFDYMDGK